MKNKTIRNRIIAIASLIVFILCFVFVGQKFYFRQVDHNAVRVQGFYLEEDNSLDVVFMGSSEMYNCFCSAEFYAKEGITSYPYAYETNPVSMWKFELKEILKHQKPKVLVIESNGTCYGDDQLYKYAAIRNLVDNIPLSQNKTDLINEFGTDSALSYYMPIVKYHEKWKSGQNPRNLLVPWLQGYNKLRGAFSHTYSEPLPEKTFVPDGKTKDLSPNAAKYFDEFLELCDESGIEHILFFRSPHRNYDQEKRTHYLRYNKTAEIVEERGYEYIDTDLFKEEMGIDMNTDFFDEDHLNASGQKKFTAWFGRYLVEKYNLTPTKLEGKQKEEWDISADYIDRYFRYYEIYIEEHKEDLKKDKELKEVSGIMKELDKLSS